MRNDTLVKGRNLNITENFKLNLWDFFLSCLNQLKT